MTKKELLQLRREHDKLDRTLGGIRDMSRVPSAIWVVDTKKEHIAVNEARKLGIPVVAILDTNCDPDEVDYPIPGNDDAIRSVALLTRVVADAVAEGLIARAGAASGDEKPASDQLGTQEPLAEWERELLQGSASAAASAPADAAAPAEEATLADTPAVAAAVAEATPEINAESAITTDEAAAADEADDLADIAETAEATAAAPEPTAEAAAPEPTAEAAAAAEPTAAATEPTAQAAEPTAQAAEPTAQATEPTAEAAEPTAEAAEPTAEAGETSAE